MKRIIVIALLVVLAVAAFVGYRMYQEKTPDIVNRKPDVVITATALIAAFEQDTGAAAKSYIDKVLEVSGTVTSIDTAGSVVLGDVNTLSSVTVSLDRRHSTDYKNLKVGETAVLQGVCSGYSISGGNPDDLFAGLGTTVELNFAGVKK